MTPGAGPTATLAAFTGSQWAIILGFLAIGLVLHGALVAWLYRDVRASGHPTTPWTITGALLLVPTLLVWAVVRPRPEPQRAYATASRQRDEAMRRSAAPYGDAPVASYGAPRTEWDAATDEGTFPDPARIGDDRTHTGPGDGTLHCTWCGEASSLPGGPGTTVLTCPSCGTEQRR